MWKTGGEVDVKPRNQVTVFDVTTNITILFAIANDMDCWVFFGQCLFSYFRLPSLSSGVRVRPR